MSGEATGRSRSSGLSKLMVERSGADGGAKRSCWRSGTELLAERSGAVGGAERSCWRSGAELLAERSGAVGGAERSAAFGLQMFYGRGVVIDYKLSVSSVSACATPNCAVGTQAGTETQFGQTDTLERQHSRLCRMRITKTLPTM